jgi:hypothetical protein
MVKLSDLLYHTQEGAALIFNYLLFFDVDEIRGLFGDEAGKAAKRAGKIFLVIIIVVGICLILFRSLTGNNREFEYVLILISFIASIYVIQKAIKIDDSKM